MLYINHKISIPAQELSFSYARSPGPGGQHVNKVNSKVILKWPVKSSPSLPLAVKLRFVAKFKNRISNDGVLVLSSYRFRQRQRNVNDCLEKLQSLLKSVAETPKARKKKKVSQAAKRRRLDNKRQRSETKRLRGPVKD